MTLADKIFEASMETENTALKGAGLLAAGFADYSIGTLDEITRHEDALHNLWNNEDADDARHRRLLTPISYKGDNFYYAMGAMAVYGVGTALTVAGVLPIELAITDAAFRAFHGWWGTVEKSEDDHERFLHARPAGIVGTLRPLLGSIYSRASQSIVSFYHSATESIGNVIQKIRESDDSNGVGL